MQRDNTGMIRTNIVILYNRSEISFKCNLFKINLWTQVKIVEDTQRKLAITIVLLR